MEHLSVTITIVIITFLISYRAFNRPDLIDKYRHYPYREAKGETYRLLTGGFFHGSWLHLLINLFVLWQFGEMVEAYYKHWFGDLFCALLFLLMYLSCVMVANLFTFGKHRNNPYFSSIGASGAVSGVVFIYILIGPWQMLYLYAIIPIPGIVAGLLFLWYSSWAGKKGGDLIDHDAHYYGALYGILFTLLLKPSLPMDFINKLVDIPFL